jgi:uncharacterized protein (TIGR00251 family)
MHGGAIKLRLQARPVEGAANAALVEFLADAFRVPKRQVELVTGAASRDKQVRIVAPERAHADSVLRDWGIDQMSS